MLYVHTSIHPDTPCVVLRDTSAREPHQALSGRVLFRLGRSLKVKRIVAAFQSTSTQLVRKPVLLNEVLFDGAGDATGYVLWKASHTASTTYELPFSFILPHDLEASINTGYGNICYEVKVTVHTCGFGINTWSQSLKIPVYRIPPEESPQALTLTESLQIQADWLSMVQLQVSSDTAAISDSTGVSIRAAVRPLQKGLGLVDIGLRLYETICYKQLTDRHGEPRSTQRVICQCQKATGDPAEGLHTLPLWQEFASDLTLQIPKAFSGVQYSMNTRRLKVVHKIAFIATVVDERQSLRHLRISSPVYIVPRAALDATFSELPAYRSSSFDRLLLESASTEAGEPGTRLPPPPSYRCAVSGSDLVFT
ncbi:hypothetical protein GGF46_001335 [Coemansia sp. RSA 552]|nr:hypothetical protein GGF46_001335 [Coemansia sp. RSA 552]